MPDRARDGDGAAVCLHERLRDRQSEPDATVIAATSQIEIRQVFEVDDFGDAATPELRAQEESQRARSAANRK